MISPDVFREWIQELKASAQKALDQARAKATPVGLRA